MPISTPIAASASRSSPERVRRIPQAVQSACLTMIYDGLDLVAASRAHGLRPDTLRKWLHRAECVAFVRRSRAVYRAAICASNEHALLDIRNNAENAMAKVNAIKLLEAIEDNKVVNPASTTPGIVIRVVNVAPPASPPTIDVTPQHAEPALPTSTEPIFKVP